MITMVHRALKYLKGLDAVRKRLVCISAMPMTVIGLHHWWFNEVVDNAIDEALTAIVPDIIWTPRW